MQSDYTLEFLRDTFTRHCQEVEARRKARESGEEDPPYVDDGFNLCLALRVMVEKLIDLTQEKQCQKDTH